MGWSKVRKIKRRMFTYKRGPLTHFHPRGFKDEADILKNIKF